MTRETTGISGDSQDKPLNPMKYDSQTVPVQLLPTIPLMAIAQVFGYGAKKYAANSWRNPDTKAVQWSRTYGSVMRHLLLWAAGEDEDEESGFHHLHHAGTQLMILIEHVATEAGEDDRYTGSAEQLALFRKLWDLQNMPDTERTQVGTGPFGSDGWGTGKDRP